MKRSIDVLRNEYNQAIDFDTVLEQIASFASFSCSVQTIQQAMPLTDLMEIQYQLNLAGEAMELERKGALLNMAGCSDVRPFVDAANKQMVLQGSDLNAIALFLSAVRNVQSNLTETKLLRELADTMNPYGRLVKEIQSKIDGTGQVKETATSTLKQAFTALVDTRMALQAKGRQFIKKNSSKLMESMTTTIQGRLCVLVKAQDKNTFGGMIHGQSQSGLAYYIEPNAFVTENNRIQMLESEIEEEKVRICRQLTKAVSKGALEILSDLETMTLIDAALAKGRWAYRFDGCIPTIQNRNASFCFEKARHPLIPPEKVVANTYKCKENEKCLMISGPNMGGKTVTLKTIGLFMVLAHAGFPVIAHRAVLPLYESFWFDIGDRQSIENNLSTFSSHISKIAEIVKHSDSHSFILVDELGNGTDPLEGASLAIAILEALIKKQCTVITSTHYSQVKAFGKTNAQVLVSSVEFDSESLQPTYKYLPGVSGSSYAFDIAAQYDLDAEILRAAKKIKAENTPDTDQELERLEILQNEVQKEKNRFDRLIQNVHDLQRQTQQKADLIEKQKKKMDADYQEQLEMMLEEKRAEAKAIIAELKDSSTYKMHEKTALLHKLNTMGKADPEKEKQAQPLKAGDYVQVSGLHSHGEIIDIRKQEATVLSNGMKMKIQLNRLEKIQRPNVKKTPPKIQGNRSLKRFPLECNLIGMHVDEAIRALDDYIDSAVANRIKQVRIVHGMGTGALRNAVWQALDTYSAVKEKSTAGPGDGGLGATIVQLK